MKRIVVLAKQVPDTANVGSDAMKEDGTVNRAALTPIFNPEDLNALEMALQVKEKLGWEVHVISMGPPSAVTVLKQSLYMGADQVHLISDRKFAGSDTLATSRVLARAVERLGDVALVFAGRQAIDGDTAQVGPQVANLIGFNVVGFVSELREVTSEHLVLARDAEVQTEVVQAPLPLLVTVMNTANEPRFPNVHRMLQYFRADLREKIPSELQGDAERNGWIIPQLDAASLGIDDTQTGLKGSPTKVFNIKNITLTGKSLELYPAQDHGIRALMKEITKEYAEVSE